MATTTIRGLRCKVVPVDVPRDYIGDTTIPPATAYDVEQVLLTREALAALGGSPLRQGETWTCYLDLLYVTTAGALAAQAITTAAVAGSILTVYDPLTSEVLATRQLDTVIPDSGGLKELALIGAGAPGRVRVTWHATEAAKHPPVGRWAWGMVLDIGSVDTIVAQGLIDVEQGIPEVTP